MNNPGLQRTWMQDDAVLLFKLAQSGRQRFWRQAQRLRELLYGAGASRVNKIGDDCVMQLTC